MKRCLICLLFVAVLCVKLPTESDYAQVMAPLLVSSVYGIFFALVESWEEYCVHLHGDGNGMSCSNGSARAIEIPMRFNLAYPGKRCTFMYLSRGAMQFLIGYKLPLFLLNRICWIIPAHLEVVLDFLSWCKERWLARSRL